MWPDRAHASWLAGATLFALACAGANKPHGTRLPAGISAGSPEFAASGYLAMDLQRATDLSRGALTYALAWAESGLLTAVELGVEFALVTRAISASGQKFPRVRLGGADRDIEDLAIHGPRQQVFVAGRDGRVRGFDTRSGRLVVTWSLGSPVTALAVAASGEYVAMGTSDGVLCLRRYRDGALLQCALAHRGQISALAFRRDDSELASAAWTGTVTRWRMPTLATIERREFAGAACDLAFSPDGRQLAVARSAFPPRRSPPQVARARDQRSARSGHRDHAISLWSLRDGGVQDLTGHRGPVTSVAWSPDGARLVSGSWDGSVRLWASVVGSQSKTRELARHGGFSPLVRDVAVSPDGRYVAVGAWTDGRDGPATTLLHLLYRRANRPSRP